jgi:alkaline phosphatase
MYESPYTYAKPGLVDRIAAQKKSFGDILDEFEDLDEEEQTPEKLMELFNANSDFPITLEEARSLFVEVPNPYYLPGDDDRGFITLPQIHDFSEFYPGEPFDRRMNLLGRAVGPEQYTSWATGTHTHTPVILFAMGPAAVLAQYPTIMHMTDFGRITKQALTGGN